MAKYETNNLAIWSQWYNTKDAKELGLLGSTYWVCKETSILCCRIRALSDICVKNIQFRKILQRHRFIFGHKILGLLQKKVVLLPGVTQCWNKKQPNFSKLCSRSGRSRFYIEKWCLFQNSLKSHQIFGLLFILICRQKFQNLPNLVTLLPKNTGLFLAHLIRHFLTQKCRFLHKRAPLCFSNRRIFPFWAGLGAQKICVVFFKKMSSQPF